MAIHRTRVCVGYNDDGNPIVQRVQGSTELEMADQIVRAILKSPRRSEFLPAEALAEKLAPANPTLREYTEEWRRTQNVKTVQSIMGHSDFKTTTDRYVHPVDARKQSAIQQVGDLISDKRGGEAS